ncbi:hypothetical protein F4805DRAFT_460862 [Annulohypoxylon moriforme]|nr:hypothetical protein F4805DRAFT_460862 [Annulohypoxylon moriforme]
MGANNEERYGEEWVRGAFPEDTIPRGQENIPPHQRHGLYMHPNRHLPTQEYTTQPPNHRPNHGFGNPLRRESFSALDMPRPRRIPNPLSIRQIFGLANFRGELNSEGIRFLLNGKGLLGFPTYIGDFETASAYGGYSTQKLVEDNNLRKQGNNLEAGAPNDNGDQRGYSKRAPRRLGKMNYRDVLRGLGSVSAYQDIPYLTILPQAAPLRLRPDNQSLLDNASIGDAEVSPTFYAMLRFCIATWMDQPF